MLSTGWFVLLGILLVAIGLWTFFRKQKREATWKQVARDLGADYVGGGLFGTGKVVAHLQRWTVTLDIHTVTSSSGEGNTYTYTRMRAPIQNPKGFELTVYPEGTFGRTPKGLGSYDIQVGDPDFDRLFAIWSNDQSRARSLLTDARLRQLIQQQPGIELRVKGPVLHFETRGAVRDLPRLEALFDLFSVMLPALER
jgi:LPXTG-motif cell wall-anchored protein